MNEFLGTRFVEGITRLALGLEPIDAERGTRVAHPIRVLFDEAARGLPRPPVERHDSCLHALRYTPGLAERVRLRFVEDERRLVPRSISYPILSVAAAEAASHVMRVRRPRLFPGAAYDLGGGPTGLRGRVERGGRPLRWARVVATLPNTSTVVGRAHGDDRGEFLLLVAAAAGAVGDLADPLTLRVVVSGPAVAPVPSSPDLPGVDPLWDLPEEVASAIDPADPASDAVSAGTALPAGYTATATRDVAVRLGQVISDPLPFTIP